MPRLTFTNISGLDIPLSDPSGYGKSFTIPAAGGVVDLTGVQLETMGPILDARRVAGLISWVKTENPGVSDDLEISAGVVRLGMFLVGPVAAKNPTLVHASVLATAANAFLAPFTPPDVPRCLSVVAAATYDGGAITITGTNQFDQAQTETIAGTANTTTYGVKVFKTITAISKATVGVAAAGASIGTGDVIGVPVHIADTNALLYVGNIIEAVTMNVANSSFVPTTVPSATSYKLLANTPG